MLIFDYAADDNDSVAWWCSILSLRDKGFYKHFCDEIEEPHDRGSSGSIDDLVALFSVMDEAAVAVSEAGLRYGRPDGGTERRMTRKLTHLLAHHVRLRCRVRTIFLRRLLWCRRSARGSTLSSDLVRYMLGILAHKDDCTIMSRLVHNSQRASVLAKAEVGLAVLNNLNRQPPGLYSRASVVVMENDRTLLETRNTFFMGNPLGIETIIYPDPVVGSNRCVLLASLPLVESIHNRRDDILRSIDLAGGGHVEGVDDYEATGWGDKSPMLVFELTDEQKDSIEAVILGEDSRNVLVTVSFLPSHDGALVAPIRQIDGEDWNEQMKVAVELKTTLIASKVPATWSGSLEELTWVIHKEGEYGIQAFGTKEFMPKDGAALAALGSITVVLEYSFHFGRKFSGFWLHVSTRNS